MIDYLTKGAGPMRKRRKNTIAVVTFFLLLICGTAIVVFLKENTHQAGPK